TLLSRDQIIHYRLILLIRCRNPSLQRACHYVGSYCGSFSRLLLSQYHFLHTILYCSWCQPLSLPVHTKPGRQAIVPRRNHCLNLWDLLLAKNLRILSCCPLHHFQRASAINCSILKRPHPVSEVL